MNAPTPSTLRSSLRAMPAPAWVLFAGTFVNRLDEAHLPTARASILADPGFLLFLAGALLSGSVYAQNVSSLPLHVRDAGFEPSTYGALQSLNGVIVVLAELR